MRLSKGASELAHQVTKNGNLFFLNSLKTASPARQEQARLEVENAEDDLVQKTEVAITLMKTVLENVGYFICLRSMLVSPFFLSLNLSRI